jgi:hypothetical protein
LKILAVMCLAIVWAAFLVPPMLRRRREGRPASSVVMFRQQLSTLERATPGSHLRPIPVATHRADLGFRPGSLAPRSRSEVVRRRRDVLIGLVGATAFTALLAVLLGGAFATLLFLASGGALAAYCYALVQLRKRAEEASAKVRVLRPQARPVAGPLAVRRSATS